VFSRCKFHLGDLTAPVEGKLYDVVLANLPYIPSGEIPAAPNPVGHEPLGALDGGPDGLAEYRRLLPRLPGVVKADALVLLEAAPRTIDALRDLAAEQFPKAKIEVMRDYGELDRFVSILMGRGFDPSTSSGQAKLG